MPRKKARKIKTSCYIGIDNGVTGSIGMINDFHETEFIKTPTYKEQDYTDRQKIITRIEILAFEDTIWEWVERCDRVKVMIERPLVNARMFQASVSAVRCFEATLVILKQMDIIPQVIDSKEWQSELLPKQPKAKRVKKGEEKEKKKKGEGAAKLKAASRMIGVKLFPEHEELIMETNSNGKYLHDADGILIAEHCRRFYR